MGKRLVTKTAKVLSETKKSKEKEVVAISYEHIPRDPKQQEYGSIYAVIEIEDSGGHAEELAEKIIDIFHDAYYNDLDKDPYDAFEEALSQINDELTDRSSEGQIGWLGKLNAVLAVLSGNTLHVTQAGKAEAYLYRNEHTMHITEDLAGDAINPQRTFLNIASGELAEKDKVIILTPGVFYKLSKREIKDQVTQNSPKVAAENISKIILGKDLVRPNAVMIMEFVSPESFVASEEDNQEENEIWIGKEKDSAEELGGGFVLFISNFFTLVGNLFSKTVTFLKEKAVPKIKDLTQKVSRSKPSRKKEEVLISSDEKIISQKKTPEISKEDYDVDDGIIKDEEIDKEIRIKETRKFPKLLSLERFDFSFLERLKDGFLKATKKLFPFSGKRNSLIYLTIAIIVAVVLALAIFNNNVKNIKTEQNNKLTQATSLYEEALSNITAGNYLEASNNLISAEKIATEVANTKYFQEEAQELLSKINSTKDEAQRITRNTASLFYEFPQEVDRIFYNDGLIYGLNFKDGSIYSVDPKNGTASTIVEKPKIDSEILAATVVESRNTLVAYTNQKTIFEVNLDNGNLSEQKRDWEEAEAIGFFGTNIYLLSKKDQQIYKHLRFSSGYGAKIPYFEQATNISDVVDIAIDGYIYTTNKNAEVKRYLSGKADSYSVSDLPQNYDNIKGIYAHPDVTGIYLYSNNAIIKINEEGKFVAQYKNDDAQKIDNLFVDEDSRTIYFLSDNKIFSINY